MFQPNGVALDIFGDKETSDARRRCQPAEGDEQARALFDMHLSVANLYATGYMGLTFLPWCAEEITALYETFGTPLSLVADTVDSSTPTSSSNATTSSWTAEWSYSFSFDDEPASGLVTDTPWGLAKSYIDEVAAFLMENDGWNADGGLGGKQVNLIPFTGDFSYADSSGSE